MLPDDVETTIQLASLRQILGAITHFHAGEFECAITLAAAGEGILPDPSEENSYLFGLLRHRQDELDPNAVINWLKHGKDYRSATISQFEVAITVARGISKFIAAYRKSHPTFEEFMDWGRGAGHFPWYPEFVPVMEAGGEPVLFDMYDHSTGARVWLGSRRTRDQCIEAVNSMKRAKQQPRTVSLNVDAKAQKG